MDLKNIKSQIRDLLNHIVIRLQVYFTCNSQCCSDNYDIIEN